MCFRAMVSNCVKFFWIPLCIENRPLGQELALFRSWHASAESIVRDSVSPPLCSITKSSEQEPSLWLFSLADIPESLSCIPLHSTRKKRGVSALLKHTRATDLTLLEPFHTLSRAHQWWAFSGDRAETRKAYRALPERQSIFQEPASGWPMLEVMSLCSAELLQEERDTNPTWGHTNISVTLALVQMQRWCSKVQPCTALMSVPHMMV